ncbi:MAG: hypothetical protein WCL02_01045 [bacterium]
MNTEKTKDRMYSNMITLKVAGISAIIALVSMIVKSCFVPINTESILAFMLSALGISALWPCSRKERIAKLEKQIKKLEAKLVARRAYNEELGITDGVQEIRDSLEKKKIKLAWIQ